MKKKMRYCIIFGVVALSLSLHAQAYSKQSRSKKISIRKTPKYPPFLEAKVRFNEPSGNKILDAEETGRLEVTVKNSGKGESNGIALNISLRNDQWISFSKVHEIGDIKPGKQKTITIPIKADFKIDSKTVNMNFNFSEKNGFEPDPTRLTFQTKAFVVPELVLVDGLDIEDGNNNGMVESGELVTITAAIQNIGQGIANGVNVFLTKGENVFFGGDSKTNFSLGKLEPGALKRFTFDAYTNKRADAILIYASISESKGKFGKPKQRLPLEFKKRVSKISDVQVVGVENSNLDIAMAEGFAIDVEKNIPKIGIKNKDAIAVVIGNREYAGDVPDVDFAIRDATYLREYLLNTFGYREGNIFYYENATLSNIKVAFNKLKNAVRVGKSDVFVYYSGHGAPDPESKQGYFVPVDADPNFIKETGFPLGDLYSLLNNTGARSTTVVIDACFSGSSDQGMILKDISPVFIEVDNKSSLNIKNSALFTSATGEQVSSWYREKKHSLFTYYFLKALQGSADMNSDKKLTLNEIKSYIDDNVPYEARRINNRKQTPMLQANKLDRVFSSYK